MTSSAKATKANNKKREWISQAIAAQAIVRFPRPEIDVVGRHLVGVPTALGAEWLVLARIDDNFRFDGFDALRFDDVLVDRDFKGRSTLVRALNLRRARAPSAVGIDPNDSRRLLASVALDSNLVVVERERTHVGADIGRVVSLGESAFRLALVNTLGMSERHREAITYRAITRIGFGGAYDESLAAVAGLTCTRWR